MSGQGDEESCYRQVLQSTEQTDVGQPVLTALAQRERESKRVRVRERERERDNFQNRRACETKGNLCSRREAACITA